MTSDACNGERRPLCGGETPPAQGNIVGSGRRAWWRRMFGPARRSRSDALPPDVAAWLADSYPRNHTYAVSGGRPVPHRKLARRWRRLRRLYPRPLTSLLDLSCSKGFFVFAADAEPTCRRSLGIDVSRRDLAACRVVNDHLQCRGARFAHLQLHELAAEIDRFGGPFQTVLLVNTYQYLYYGSDCFEGCYANHETIFGLMAAVCSGRLIFANRTEFDSLQESCRMRADRAPGPYTGAAILDAAQEHFDLTRRGRLGRYPLWVLDRRKSETRNPKRSGESMMIGEGVRG